MIVGWLQPSGGSSRNMQSMEPLRNRQRSAVLGAMTGSAMLAGNQSWKWRMTLPLPEVSHSSIR